MSCLNELRNLKVWVNYLVSAQLDIVRDSAFPSFLSCSVEFFHTAQNELCYGEWVPASGARPPPTRVGVGQKQCLPSKSACLIEGFSPPPPPRLKKRLVQDVVAVLPQ